MFLSFQTSSLHGKVIGMMVEDNLVENYMSLFISYIRSSVVYLLQHSILSHFTTFINAFQTLLLFGTGIFKPVSFYCKSKFWLWIIIYSDLSVTFSINLHYSFTTHSPRILGYYGGITVVLRYYYGVDTV